MKLLKEPLTHFLLLGAALFWFYYEVADPQSEYDDLIVVSEADIERLQAGWERQWGRPALQNELNSLVQSFVREEVLNREAVALGLEAGDSVIRRRLAQKMEFLFSDLADQAELTEDDLQTYFEANQDRFLEPGTVTFTHIYFSPDRRGESVHGDAELALGQLFTEPESDLSHFGDPFMYRSDLEAQRQDDVARMFGSQFAEDLFGQQAGDWAGPIASGFGVHLVRIEGFTDPVIPPLDDVRNEVVYELRSERQKKADEAFYAGLRQPLPGTD